MNDFETHSISLDAFFPPFQLAESPNLVPRSLEDEAEGEIWPNPICIT